LPFTERIHILRGWLRDGGGTPTRRIATHDPGEDWHRVHEDRTLSCRDCGQAFIFSAGEQAFFASKGLQNVPQRCPSCRAAARRARATDGPREFHAAVCARCGGQAVVPFAPRADKPVYCSQCFEKVRPAPAPTA
jgi:CxxC-x17-CxxC domain-containing protein